jgi:UDP-N-acetylglucosamine:LPS N-acetylglucosamine transferase
MNKKLLGLLIVSLSSQAFGYRLLFLTANNGHMPSAIAVTSSLKRLSPLVQIDLANTGPAHLELLYNYTMSHYPKSTAAFLHLLGLAHYCATSYLKLPPGFPTISNISPNKFTDYDLILLNFPFIVHKASTSCQSLGMPLLIIPSDIGEPPWPYWIHPNPSTIYLLGSKYLLQSASKLNHPNHVPISGMVLRPEFRHIRDIPKREMKLKLGLDPDKKVVLVLFGSAGSNVMLDIANLARRDTSKQYIFICAGYKELKAKIDLLKTNHFITTGYINNVHEYMRAADVFIGKPGPGCVSESIQCETPVLLRHRFIWDTMPQEVPTIWYIKEHNLGKVITSYKEELLPAINQLIDNPPTTFPLNNAADQCAVAIMRLLKDQLAVKNRTR